MIVMLGETGMGIMRICPSQRVVAPRRCPEVHFPGSGKDLQLRPLGYEANGARPRRPIGSLDALPGLGRPSIASHIVQAFPALPTTSLLPFLLRSTDL
jgi:hypothetical protein